MAPSQDFARSQLDYALGDNPMSGVPPCDHCFNLT